MEENEALDGRQEEIKNIQANEEIIVEEKPKETSSMESLLSEGELGLEFPAQGEIRKGVIATIRENEILVSIGTKSEGVISGREFDQIPEEERGEFQPGQEIPVYVIAPEDPNGNVVLSYLRAKEEQDWEIVAALLETGSSFDSVVIGYNKGGLIVPIGMLRGFVPASQVSILRRQSFTGETPEERWGTLVGEPMQVSVIEMDRSRRRLILSERIALQETRDTLKDRLLDELHEGIVRKGRVTSLADFGAFVNIEGADGLVHLSEISWERIQHPNEVLKVGQEVDVKVISIDSDRKRIGLSIRQLQEDPWKQKVSHLREGLLVEGTITHLTKFGAFARIGEDIEGLIHISELSEQRIDHPKEIVHEGDVVTLRIIKIDTDRRRIGLSLKKVDSPAYADLDWKTALAEEVDRAHEEEILEIQTVSEIPVDVLDLTQEFEEPEEVLTQIVEMDEPAESEPEFEPSPPPVSDEIPEVDSTTEDETVSMQDQELVPPASESTASSTAQEESLDNASAESEEEQEQTEKEPELPASSEE